MLRRAFDALGIERFELKTDALDQPSRRAIARIGAVEEGTPRHHMITSSGRLRDSVYFSVVRAGSGRRCLRGWRVSSRADRSRRARAVARGISAAHGEFVRRLAAGVALLLRRLAELGEPRLDLFFPTPARGELGRLLLVLERLLHVAGLEVDQR